MVKFSRVFCLAVIIASFCAIISSASYSFEVKGDWIWGGIATLEFSSTDGFKRTHEYFYSAEVSSGSAGPWFESNKNSLDTVNFGIFSKIWGDYIPCYAGDSIIGVIHYRSQADIALHTFTDTTSTIKCKVRLVREDEYIIGWERRNDATLEYKTVWVDSEEFDLSASLEIDMDDFKRPSVGSTTFSLKWNNQVVSNPSRFLQISTLELTFSDLPSNAIIPITGHSTFTKLRGYEGRSKTDLEELVDASLFAPFTYGYNENLKCADQVRLAVNPYDFSTTKTIYIVTGSSPKNGVCKIPFTKTAYSLAFSNSYYGLGFAGLSFDDEAEASLRLQIGYYTNSTISLGKIDPVSFTFGFNFGGAIIILQIAKEKGHFSIDNIYGDQDLFEDSEGIWVSYNIWDFLKEEDTPVETEVEQFKSLMAPQEQLQELFINPFNVKIGINELKLGEKKKYKTDRKSNLAVVTITLDEDKAKSPSSFDYTIGETKGYMSLASTSVTDFGLWTSSELTYKDDIITHNFEVFIRAGWILGQPELTGDDIPVQARFRIYPKREFRASLTDFECKTTEEKVVITKTAFGNDYLDQHYLTMYDVTGSSTGHFNITCSAAVGSIASNLDEIVSTVLWLPRGFDTFAIPSITTGRITDTTAIRAKHPPLTRFHPDLYVSMIVGEIKSQTEFETQVQYAIDLINSQRTGDEPTLKLSDLRFIAPVYSSSTSLRNAFSSPHLGRSFDFDSNSISSLTARGSFLTFAFREDFMPATVTPSSYIQSKGFGGLMANDKAIVVVQLSPSGNIGIDVQAKYLGGSTSAASFATLSFEEQQAVQTEADVAAAFGGLPAGAKCESSSQCDEGFYCYKSACTVRDELDITSQTAVHALSGGDSSFGVSLYADNNSVMISTFIALTITFIALLL